MRIYTHIFSRGFNMKARYLAPIMIILMSSALLISPYFFLLLIAVVVES